MPLAICQANDIRSAGLNDSQSSSQLSSIFSVGASSWFGSENTTKGMSRASTSDCSISSKMEEDAEVSCSTILSRSSSAPA